MTQPSDPPALPATPAAVIEEIEKISSLIGGAEKLLGDHKQVDLGALEGRIAALCAALGRLPENEGQAIKGRLETMLDQLDVLEKALSAEHESLSSLLEGETRAKEMAAARSYGAHTPKPSLDDAEDDADETDT